jgi:aminoglycoside phosphotransferase (APT) family kinase protein
VLVDRGVRVIDFDEVRLGDPMHDVAHFCAHLRLLACRTPDAAPGRFRALERAFLDAYARRGGAPVGEQFPWFAAYTCLKIAKQLCTVRGVRPRPDGEERSRQLAIMLAEGLAFGAGG